MNRIIQAQLPLAETFVLPARVGHKVIGIQAYEDETSPSGLVVNLLMEADELKPMQYRWMIWLQTGADLPDEPCVHVATITPGRTALHLYALMARKVGADIISNIENARTVALEAARAQNERAETDAKLCDVICGPDAVMHKESCPRRAA